MYKNVLYFFSLEMLDKLEPPSIPEGYGISIAFYCLLEITRSIQLVIIGPQTNSDGKLNIKI